MTLAGEVDHVIELLFITVSEAPSPDRQTGEAQESQAPSLCGAP